MNVDECIDTLKEGGIIEEAQVKILCDRLQEILMDESKL